MYDLINVVTASNYYSRLETGDNTYICHDDHAGCWMLDAGLQSLQAMQVMKLILPIQKHKFTLGSNR